MQQIALGATVTTADGKELGTIDKLILDPDTGTVRSIVVRKGFLFTRDLELDLDSIAGQEGGTVRLRHTSAEVDALPEFLEGSYTTLPPDRAAMYETSAGYPASSLLFPSRWSGPVYGEPYGHEATGAVGEEVAALHQQQDLANAVIDEGSEVRSRDGEKVGSVHRIVFDPANGRPSAIVVRKGFLFTEDVELPASLISSAGDGVVYLDATHDELERRTHETAR